MNYAQAINEAMFYAMEQDKSVICFGLGVDDPKRIFGTTLGLKERFGPDRVFDMPRYCQMLWMRNHISSNPSF
ncbi:MAG: hypothetical protein HQ569_03060 [Actinobacteria bacterium]|nr:hypothetical protein [Actinomycetota bacterium]